MMPWRGVHNLDQTALAVVRVFVLAEARPCLFDLLIQNVGAQTKLLGRLLASGFIINDVEAGEALDFYLSVHRFVGVGGVGHVDAPAALEGGPNCSRSRIPSSCAHSTASSTLQAFCLSAMPMVSSVFEISLARAVAARSTCIRYSLSPLDSPSLGFTWLAGLGIEDKANDPSGSDTALPWRGRRFLFGFQVFRDADATSLSRRA